MKFMYVSAARVLFFIVNVKSYRIIVVTRRLMLMTVKVRCVRVRMTRTFSTSECTKTRRFLIKNCKNCSPKNDRNCFLVTGRVAFLTFSTKSSDGNTPRLPIVCPRNTKSVNPTEHLLGLQAKFAARTLRKNCRNVCTWLGQSLV